MTKATFTTVLWKDGGINATAIKVPPEVVASLSSKKRVPVRVTIGDYTYRSTLVVYNGAFMIPLAQEHRAAAGVEGGDEVEITLEVDTDPRTVEVPADLAAALDAANARAAFDAQSYTNRKEAVRQVETAKAQETRERRIASIVAKLATG